MPYYRGERGKWVAEGERRRAPLARCSLSWVRGKLRTSGYGMVKGGGDAADGLLPEGLDEEGFDGVYVGGDAGDEVRGVDGGEGDGAIGEVGGEAGDADELFCAEVGGDGVIELGEERGDLGEDGGGDDLGLEGFDEGVLAQGAGGVSTGLDGADVFGGVVAVEDLGTSGEDDAAFGGDLFGYGDLYAAEGVYHGGELGHFDGDVVAGGGSEVVGEDLGDDTGCGGVLLTSAAGGGYVGVFEGDAEGCLGVVDVVEGGSLDDEVAGEGDDGDLLGVEVYLDEADGVCTVGGIAAGGV